MPRHWKLTLPTALLALALVPLTAAVPVGLPSDAPLDVCLPACTVGAHTNAYATPVTVVASGAMLTWQSLDGTYHSATSADYALDARIFSGEQGGGPGSATFEIREDGLYVRNHGEVSDDPDPFTKSTAAVSLGDGSYVLEYACLFHGKTQQGALAIVPNPT